MATYKITFRNGQHAQIEDPRQLDALVAALCQEGFIIVQRLGAYDSDPSVTVALLERHVGSIEAIE